jgi:hypothetical protein
MKQYAELFERDMMCEDCVATQLNNFLDKHPDYEVTHMSYAHGKHGTCSEYLFVIFKVWEGV